MTFRRPTLSSLADQAEAEIRTRLGVGPLLRRSVLAVLARVMAGLAHSANGFIEFAVRQILPDTAVGEFLERHGSLRGVVRKPATFAAGSVLVTGGRVDNVTLADTFAGSTTTVQDGGVVSVLRYTNAGLTTIDSGGLIETGQTFIRPAGEVRVGPGGTLRGTNGMFVDDGATLALDCGTVDVVSNFLDVSGEMLVTGDAQVLSIGAGGLVLTGGDARIASVGDATLEGTIFGQGSIFGSDAPITLEGSVAPGLASSLLTVGTIEWIGDVSLGSAAELVIDVLDLSSHDVIAHRTDTATLGGTLKVALGADYTPTDGDAFDIVTSSGSLDGRFTGIDAPELGDNLFFTIDYTGSAARLRVVPAPAGAALLGVAGVLAGSRRRPCYAGTGSIRTRSARPRSSRTPGRV
ncbi:MAG: baseplate J/gp47 family protein [Planctomycetota bacterium]